MADDSKKNEPEQTLTDEEIQTEGNIGRRSVLSILGVGVVGGAVASVASACVVRTTTPAVHVRTTRVHSGVTDGDSGSYADPAGYGRGHSGITDSDSGSYADPAGRGRGHHGHRRHTGLTDSDSGNYSDAAGYGRRGYKE